MLSYADSVIKRAVLLGSSVLQVVCEDGGEINYGLFRFGVLACGRRVGLVLVGTLEFRGFPSLGFYLLFPVSGIQGFALDVS